MKPDPQINAVALNNGIVYAHLIDLQKHVESLDKRMDEQTLYIKSAVDEAKRDRDAIRQEILDQGKRSQEQIQKYHDTLLEAIRSKSY